MFKKLINKFIVNQDIYKKLEEETIYYHSLWENVETDKKTVINAIKEIYLLVQGEDKKDKIIKEVIKICKEVLK